MSERPAKRWDQVVDEKRTLFSQQGCELRLTISNEDAFRSAFEGLCEEYEEKYCELLLNRLLSSSDRINSFMSGISGGKEDQGSAGLMSLIWESGYAVVEAASIYDPSQTVSPDGYIKAAGTEIARAKQRFEIAVDNAKKEAARAQLNPPGPHFKRQTRQASLPNVFEDQDEHPTDTSVRFIYIQSLGQSSTAIVDEVKEVSSGETFARKSVHIHYQKDAQQLEADMKNEYKIMKRLRHVHIAEVLFHVKNAEACMVFMLPVADRNLQSFLEACIDKCFPEADTESIYSWFSCLISALAYAHEQRIRHRDIKPTNILVKDGRPYLADFGVSKDFTEAGTSSSYANTVFGTPVYRAPEISPKAERGRAADVFSMGCVFSEMLTVCMRKSLEEFRTYRKGPITSLGDHAFRENLAKVNEWLWELRGDKRTNVLVDQIAKMIYADPQKRRKARETVELLRTDGGLFCTCTS